MAQDNSIKTFIRVDGSGRNVPGSNVNRKKMPVTGKWREITAYECCNPTLVVDLLTTPAEVALDDVTFTLLCDDVEVATLTATVVTTEIDDVVDALNDNFSMYGTFANVDDTDISLALFKSIGDALCPDGDLSFTVTGTPSA